MSAGDVDAASLARRCSRRLPARAIPSATRAPPGIPVRYTRRGSIENRRLTSALIAWAAAADTAWGPFRELLDAATM